MEIGFQNLKANRIEEFMRIALAQGENALENEEIPVGCVFVDEKSDEIIATGYNKTNKDRNGTCHAEMVAINNVILYQGKDPDIFKNCELFVSCEPCIMCAAAIGRLGVKCVYFGCHNDRFGGNGSILSVHEYSDLELQLPYEVYPGILQKEAI